ncbi:MAG: FtsK/SpoIIIE domain-containing protein [Rothia sp. (in: high G+C Gram-positive bacteria)]|uniref:FtsK/SpoIIIE domain-containing protein n=1 Tax=Rothia sp. (in: high G+C Gram-positive bacteria) TaxID=1885016 RepID=UPI0026DF5692|nr:FtsK/SpoIIIE domain-containing protein [Rothia sp. (in: high G+C Gram-positive bacteria)]MDO5750127.1 FtsK/SpoIIIE domain-containing protein [Rothia sp. (in: high G+C Gram-positive bacteria)]
MTIDILCPHPESEYPALCRLEGGTPVQALMAPALRASFQRVSGSDKPLSCSGEHLPIISALSPAPEQPQSISVLSIIRGPDAGRSFALHRGDNSVGRHAEFSIDDPLLAPEAFCLSVQSAGISYKARGNPAPASLLRASPSPFSLGDVPQASESIPLPWGVPFSVGGSEFILSPPQPSSAAGTPKAHSLRAESPVSISPCEPLAVSMPAQRPLVQILLMIFMPLIMGGAIAFMTGMWFFMIMAVASSAMMAVHQLSSGGSGAKEYIRTLREQDLQRARALSSAGSIALGSAASSEVMVLGTGQRAAFLSGMRLPQKILAPHDNAPHYIPRPRADQAHWVSLDPAQLRAYLLQLVAADQRVHILCPEDTPVSLSELFLVLSVHPRVQMYRGTPACQELCDSLSRQREKTSGLLRSAQPLEDIVLTADTPLLRALLARHSMEGALVLCSDRKTYAEQALGELPIAHYRIISSGANGSSISYSTRHIPQVALRENVIGNHPLNARGECLRADGLSVESLLQALEYCARAERKRAESRAQDASSVHSAAQRMSQMGEASMGFSVQNAPERWAAQRYTTDLLFYLGASTSGALNMGLSSDGPHWLVGGTTGAGKSQLLRSLILSAALRYGPERLGFILVDFKGSAGLGPLAQLPHTLSMLSNFDLSAVQRALDFLRADISRRERDLQALTVNSYKDYLRLCERDQSVPKYPEIVIVVDEFRMLIESMPEAMTELMRIATIGRSLGIHLILATQRPQGAISQDIRANIAANICLRVASEQDSYNLLGHYQAAAIPASCPGAGFVSLPDGRNLPFRAPLVDALPASHTEPVLRLSLVTPTGEKLLADTTPEVQASESGGFEGEDAQVLRAIEPLLSFASHPLVHVPKLGIRGREYCPIPEELQEYVPCEYPATGYHLGSLEIARYGIRSSYIWGAWNSSSGAESGTEQGSTAPGVLSVVASTAERAAFLNSLIAQGIRAGAPVIIMTADAGYYRQLSAIDSAPWVLVGPAEIRHFSFVLSALEAGFESDIPPLLILDGLDSWLEAMLREQAVESRLYTVLDAVQRSGYRCVVTSSQALRSKAAALTHSILLTRRAVESDMLRKNAKAYPLPAPTHMTVEGAILSSLVGDVPLEAALMAPVHLPVQEFSERLSSIAAGAESAHRPLSSRDRAALDSLGQFSAEPLALSEELVLRRALAQSSTVKPAQAESNLLLGLDRMGSPVSLTIPAGGCVPCSGAPGSGVSHLLRMLTRLNPGYAAVHITGAECTTESLQQLLDSAHEPQNTLLLIDDLQYMPADVQRLLQNCLKDFRATIVGYAPWQRWMSSPLLMALSGCSRAIFMAPKSPADTDICAMAPLPEDRMSAGVQPPGRAVVVDGSSSIACQIPYDVLSRSPQSRS